MGLLSSPVPHSSLFCLLYVSDVAAPLVSGRGVAVESERLVSVKPEVQAGAGPQNHDPRAPRTYLEEFRRDPNTDK